MINEGIFSSNLQDWATPQSFVDLISKTFNYKFTLDACAYDSTTKAPAWYTEADDALTKEWTGTVWMNPPYGKAIPLWLEYAYQQSLKGTKIICLVPARSDTKWFHEIATKGKIILLEGRINFEQDGKSAGSPAFPSMLVIYDKESVGLANISTWSWKK